MVVWFVGEFFWWSVCVQCVLVCACLVLVGLLVFCCVVGCCDFVYG